MRNLLLAVLTLTSVTTAQASQKAVYGKLGNQFVTSQTAKTIQYHSTGLAYITKASSIYYESSTLSRIKGYKLKDAANLCSSEKFSKNIVVPDTCSGFLIADDLVMTAGHCINSAKDCNSMKIVFGVSNAKEVDNGFVVDDYNIYQCKRVITSSNELGNDFSVIQLDRKVKARDFFKLGDDSEITDKTSVFMMGHPLGLAATYTTPVPVVNFQGATTFRAPLDSFGGNSGSPVIDTKSNKVLGILTRGKADFEEVSNGRTNCQRYATYKENDEGETIQRIGDIKESLIRQGFELP